MLLTITALLGTIFAYLIGCRHFYQLGHKAGSQFGKTYAIEAHMSGWYHGIEITLIRSRQAGLDLGAAKIMPALSSKDEPQWKVVVGDVDGVGGRIEFLGSFREAYELATKIAGDNGRSILDD